MKGKDKNMDAVKSVVLSMVSAIVLTGSAAVRLASPFADNMVLQRGMRVPVWGRAAAGEKVSVSFAGQTKSCTAGADGTWRVDLEPLTASAEGRELKVVSATDGSGATLRNVVVGEVWFASGQSNMEMSILCGHTRYRDGNGILMTALARRPGIRFTSMPQVNVKKPVLDRKIAWHDFSAKSFRDESIRVGICLGTKGLMSAVAFYYALSLHDATGIPVAIVDVNWGGSAIEPWYADGTGGMWNGMVAAFAPMATRGFIWYQGCTNARDGRGYYGKLRHLHDTWAKAFENPALKLYIVQLAPFKKSWFEIQKAQAQYAADEKNAALAVTCDLPNLIDIHPNDKEPIGRRLALHALKDVHGFTDIVADSPTLKSWRVDAKGRFALTFNDASSWYWYNPDRSPARGFEVAGPDGVFHPAFIANRRTGGDIVRDRELIIACKAVSKPCRLRYLYSSPFTGSLYSGDSGLPLGPFELDASDPMDTRRALAKLGDALKRPELAGFRRIYSADLPARGAFPGYTFDGTKDAGAFTRVAYVLELENPKGFTDWVLAAMDAFSSKPADLGVPYAKGTCIQRPVMNLLVRSNLLSVKEVTDAPGGVIEFYKMNYRQKCALPGIGGSDKLCDFNDTPVPADPGYGAMQVHDSVNKATIFAYNNISGIVSGIPDVGIGNNAVDSPDWTFACNAGDYRVRRLTILVR